MAATVKTKIIVASAACVLLAGVSGTIAYQQLSGPRTRRVHVTPPPPPPPPPTPSRIGISGGTLDVTFAATTAPVINYMAQLHEFYDLAPGENVKFVPKPFIADRLQYYHDFMKDGSNTTTGPDSITFEFDGRTPARRNLNWRISTYGGGMAATVGHALSSVMHIETPDATISPSLLSQQLAGDWVYRAGATNAQLVEGLSQIFRQRLGLTGSLVQKPIEREAIVVSGTFVLTSLSTTLPAAPLQGREPTIYFFRGTSGPSRNIYSNARGSALQFLRHIAQLTGLPAVNEANFAQRVQLTWCDDQSAYRTDARHEIASEDQMLANITRQTGLRFTRGRRVVPTWVWEN